MPSADLDLVLDRIAVAGLMVNNLYQSDDASWRASLRDTNGGYEFGQGATMAKALTDATNKALNSSSEPFIGGKYRTEVPRKPNAHGSEVTAILSGL